MFALAITGTVIVMAAVEVLGTDSTR
jgi:hypothetical protein